MYKTKKLTLLEFIDKANNVHQNKYDYRLSDYINGRTRIKIICKEHGEFLQKAASHLRGNGCKKCNFNYIMGCDKFITKANSIHEYYYTYDKVNYINNHTKIIISCKIHGDFLQAPNHHLNGKGCRSCAFDRVSKAHAMGREKFIELSNIKHNFRYDYSLVNYKNCDSDVVIICKKHGQFLQCPYYHLRSFGCRYCTPRSRGEEVIKEILDENLVIYEREKKFDGCKYKKTLFFDFYLPHKNLCIEFDGEQHIRKTRKNIKFEDIIARDLIKNKFCIENNIRLIRIPYKQLKNLENIIMDIINE